MIRALLFLVSAAMSVLMLASIGVMLVVIAAPLGVYYAFEWYKSGSSSR